MQQVKTRQQRNEEFLERFEVDEVSEGGTGSFVMKATAPAARYGGNPERTQQEDRFNDPRFMADKWMTQRDLFDDDAVTHALAVGREKEAAEMIMSIRVFKHEEGNPSCRHCA